MNITIITIFVLAIFVGFIVNHIISNVNTIEGLEDSSDYIPPPKDSTEYTAAEVAAQLDILKKRESKYQAQMKQLAAMNTKMHINTVTIIKLQEAVAKIKEESQEFLDSK